MSQITVNTSEYELLSLIRGREEAVSSFMGSLDAKRPQAWMQYGYKEQLCFDDFYRAYKRGGAGHGAVHRILDGCWQSLPRIKSPADDKEGSQEKKAKALFKRLRLWAKLRDLDRRNLVGRYSALIFRVADGLTLDQELTGKHKLVDVVPVWENQLRVDRWQEDQAAEDFGMPLMFEYRTREVGDGNKQGKPETWVKVHPSRVLVFAEGAPGDDFTEGVPLLEAGFNALVDIEKITGGSAESYLKNSSRTLTFQYDSMSSPQTIGDDGKKLDVRAAHDQITKRVNSSIDSAVVTKGAEVGVLQTSVADPSKPFETAANLFAASIQLPFTVVFGQQTGRLASNEDKIDAINRYTSRRENELTPLIERFVSKLQELGEVDQFEYEIEWEPLGQPTDAEKTELLGKLTGAMKASFDAGNSTPLFSNDELRGVVDFESQTADNMPTEGDPSIPVQP